MATYVEPARWNEKSKESAERAYKLRDEVEEGARNQRLAKALGAERGRNRKAEYDAVNHVLNMKEAEAEDLQQRALDQYPKGTTSGSRTSRNRAEYGKPVDLPDADTGKKKGGIVSASKRADGIAKRGKTRGKMV